MGFLEGTNKIVRVNFGIKDAQDLPKMYL